MNEETWAESSIDVESETIGETITRGREQAVSPESPGCELG
jgi:hypothetical protein